MKKITAAAFSFLLLTSCQTLDAVGNDISSAWSSSGEALRSITARDVTDENTAAVKVADGETACPAVTIMPELAQMVEFQDLENPSPKTETGRATLKQASARCEIIDGQLAVHLSIDVDSTLGPKARWKETDKPSFAFPYFVAVTGPQGGVLAKEIFAVSLSYEAKQNQLSKTETITQHIPLAEDGSVPNYSILIGFQLSEEQLAFNRTQPILAGGATPSATP